MLQMRIRFFNTANNKSTKAWNDAFQKEKKEIEGEILKYNRKVAQTMEVGFGTNEPLKRVRVSYTPTLT